MKQHDGGGTDRTEAKMVFEDGTVYPGRALGARGEAVGEVVFNTALTGYQEILTDPSYKGQIVVMTYPLIGNYGVNPEDVESRGTFLEAFVVREASRIPSSARAAGDLPSFLAARGVVGIDGVDTRDVTLKVRSGGAMKAIVSSVDVDDASLLRKVRAAPGLDGADLVRLVTEPAARRWDQGLVSRFAAEAPPSTGTRHPVVAIDFGIKTNILRSLVLAGFDVTVLPAHATATEVLERRPAGVFLSNGPGDPAPLHYAIETLRGLLGKTPIFGICLGHQLLSQAIGAKTYKLKFGHHGANQPVLDVATQKVEITSQNHSFAVDPDTLDRGRAEITHWNLNDRTVEGIRLKDAPAFSVQYHPEASPGPHDSLYLFDRFRALIEGRAG